MGDLVSLTDLAEENIKKLVRSSRFHHSQFINQQMCGDLAAIIHKKKDIRPWFYCKRITL